MQDILKKTIAQIAPILISGMAAAGIAFLQSIAAQHGACPVPTTSPEAVGTLGAAIKAGHQAFTELKANLT